MTDEFTLDFTGVDSSSGFGAIPSDWYKVEITGYDDVETGENSKKLAPGTPGTNWEFTVLEGKHEGAKVWTRQWHVEQSLPFMKGLLRSSGGFTDEELSGPISLDDRDKAVGQKLWIKVKYRPASGQWDESNDVKAFKHISERVESSDEDSLMP